MDNNIYVDTVVCVNHFEASFLFSMSRSLKPINNTLPRDCNSYEWQPPLFICRHTKHNNDNCFNTLTATDEYARHSVEVTQP